MAVDASQPIPAVANSGSGAILVQHFHARAATAEHRPWRVELGAAQTSYDVFRVLRRIANEFGFSGFFVMRTLEPGATRADKAMILNSLNPDFVRAYDDLQLIAPNHFFHAMGTSLEPEIRTRSGLTADAYAGRGLEVQQLLQDFGIAGMVGMPVHSRHGKKGIVAFISSREPVFSTDLYELHYLAALAYDKLLALLAPEQPAHVVLTDRERECLSWTAAGKTSVEIAAILGISPHTVDHYLTTAGQKLDTVNRAHTVATALRRGLIA